MKKVGGWAVALVAIGLIVACGYYLWNNGGNPIQLSSIESARGFIAVLFGSGLFVVAVFALYLLTTDGNTEDVVKKFNSAKEVFTALIAVFGTMLGFYFGANQVGVNEPASVPAAAAAPAARDAAVLADARAIIEGTSTEQEKALRLRELLETASIPASDTAAPK